MRLRLNSRILVRGPARRLFAAPGQRAPNAGSSAARSTAVAAAFTAAITAAISAAITAALLLAAGAAAAAEVPAHVVKDPYYGDSLFYFYQGRFFTSVTNLMVSQQFGRMPHHTDEAEVLRGGLFLSYGMHREAGDIFTRLIAQGAPPPIRDRAWFYLAKIRYQRGLFAEAEDAIGRVERDLPPELDEERWMLLAQLLMARGDYARAAGVLNVIAIGPGSRLYARYNLGVALIKSGEVARGTAELDDIGQQSFASEEFRSLRDKANVALGFSALQENDAEVARSYLERVRLSGMLSNKALLGFGWAADSLKQPNKALVPWTELAQRDASDAAQGDNHQAERLGHRHAEDRGHDGKREANQRCQYRPRRNEGHEQQDEHRSEHENADRDQRPRAREAHLATTRTRTTIASPTSEPSA